MTGLSALAGRGGWQEAVLSVRDLDRWCTALETLFGWEEAGGGAVDPRLLAAWQVPASLRAEERLLVSPADPPRRVRLIQFDPVSPQQMRSSAMAWDTGGIFSLLVYVRDVPRTFAVAQEIGWSAHADPVDMYFQQFHNKNVVLRGWDGINFGCYTPVAPPRPTPPYDRAGAPFNAQQHVRARDPARDFYRDVLGWTAWFDGVTNLTCNNFGMPESFVGSPKNVAIMAGAADAYGQVELVEWTTFKGRDLAARCVPPHLGIVSIRIPVEDARARAADIVRRGGTLFSPPTEVTLKPYGPVVLFAVRTPDGALVEFFGAS